MSGGTLMVWLRVCSASIGVPAAIRPITGTATGRLPSSSEAGAPIWRLSSVVRSLKARLAFVLISKIYRQMYANTGIATDSARVSRSVRWARLMAIPCRRLFAGRPMPELTLS